MWASQLVWAPTKEKRSLRAMQAATCYVQLRIIVANHYIYYLTAASGPVSNPDRGIRAGVKSSAGRSRGATCATRASNDSGPCQCDAGDGTTPRWNNTRCAALSAAR